VVTPEQRRRNRRTGLALATVAIALLVGVILRKIWLG